MKGFVNQGNTCYLNAALQCLLHAPGLSNYVLSEWCDADLAKKKPNAHALAVEYAALARAYWEAPEPAVLDASALRAALCKLHKAFAAGGRQHDAHEALTVLLAGLHAAWARTPRIRPSHAYDCVNRQAWDDHIAAQGYSILTELITGQTECLVTDDAAGGTYSSVTHEHFNGLTLDLSEACVTSVTHAIRRCFEPVRVPGFRLPDGTQTTVTQTRRLVYCPLVLVLHLRRFDGGARGGGAKVDRFVDYPATLDIPLHGTYDLFAVCMHAGASSEGGHYVAVCEARGAWRLMDDATATELQDVNGVVNKDAYVLMYKKRATT